MVESVREWGRAVLGVMALALMSSCMGVDPEGFAQAEGEIVFTRVNLWCVSGKKILSTNYHQGTRLPAGTKVKITGRAANSMTFMTPDGTQYSVIRVAKYTPITLDEMVSRLFSREDVLGQGQPSEMFSPEEMENVEKGTIACGMTKEAVLMAYGYPPQSKTPDVSADTWYYWLTTRTRQPMELKFKNGRLYSIDGRIGQQTIRVYAVSDPPGAVIEADGSFVGKAPCVMTFVIEPEQLNRPRVIRATPAKPEMPRLGVICGMPVGGPVMGEYITVTDVLPLSTAHKMGVRRGDQIVSIAGAMVRSDRECFEVVKNLGFNRDIGMVVRRGLMEVKLKGKTDEIETGDFHVQEKSMPASKLLELDQKVIVFDMREKRIETKPAPPVAPATLPEKTEAGPAAGKPPVEETAALPIPAAGSGVVVAKGGYVLTCAHLVTGARTIKVRTAGGGEFDAQVVKTDAGNDWCLLRAARLDAAPVPWGGQKSVEKGGKLFCLGYPLDKATGKARPSPVIRTGSVLEATGLDGDARHIQMVMALSEGYSGSCLLDDGGRLVALVSDRLNNLIQAVAPRGAVMAGTVFVQKTEIIEPLLPDGVRVDHAGAGRAGEKLSADEIGKQRANSVVMIRVWR